MHFRKRKIFSKVTDENVYRKGEKGEERISKSEAKKRYLLIGAFCELSEIFRCKQFYLYELSNWVKDNFFTAIYIFKLF